MKNIKLSVEYQEYGSAYELPDQHKRLLDEACDASNSSYSPYSHFRVGAAVLLANGQVVKGSNQENAAYPSGLCAERVALFAAAARFPGVAVSAIAITASSDEHLIDEPVTPCGACRQVMMEFENNAGGDISVIMAGHRGKALVSPSVRNMLPLSFDGNHLIKPNK